MRTNIKLENIIMELKEKVENFKKQENELKIEILKEISKEFDKYNKESVLFHPDCEYEEDEELWGECIDIVVGSSSPLIMDRYRQIDGTAIPSYIKREDDDLRLYCSGESEYLEWVYVSLKKPSWELTVGDLYALLEILQHPLIKRINQ